MIKKYIQLLLSVNFCFTAIAVANPSDADDFDTYVEITLSDRFEQIWSDVQDIYLMYRYTSLHKLLLEHEETSFEYKEAIPESEIERKITDQILDIQGQFHTLINDRSNYLPPERATESEFITQLESIQSNLFQLTEAYKTRYSKEDKAFLSSQLEQLNNFFGTLILETSSHDLENRISFEDEPYYENTEAVLVDRLKRIWSGVENIYGMYRFQSLQTLLSEHEEPSFQYKEEIPESKIEEKIINQFSQILHIKTKFNMLLESEYQPPIEGTKSEFINQLENIKDLLAEIIQTYTSKLYSKEDKVFLSGELEQLIVFFEAFLLEISNHDVSFFSEDSHTLPTSTDIYKAENEESTTEINNIRTLLESCKEEDRLMYAQYETVLNSSFGEIKIDGFLGSSHAVDNKFVYFNQDENLIEIKHMQDDRTLCTTIWKIRSSDTSKANWETNDNICIDKTNLLSRYSIYAERLDYTLGNGKSSVRANLICKSTPENTYHILDIDYFNNFIALENGLCLFVVEGQLDEWHPDDKVFLDVLGTSIDANATHALMNASRNKKILVSLTAPRVAE